MANRNSTPEPRSAKEKPPKNRPTQKQHPPTVRYTKVRDTIPITQRTRSAGVHYIPIDIDPCIVLSGRWLAKYGFGIRRKLVIEVSNECLVIRPKRAYKQLQRDKLAALVATGTPPKEIELGQVMEPDLLTPEQPLPPICHYSKVLETINDKQSTRNCGVHYTPIDIAPCIMLSGKWISQYGLPIGESLAVEVSHERLVMRPKHTEITTQHASASKPGE